MNTIRLIGQAISSTNYATSRIFNFNPEPIKEAGENFLASGITEIEIPEAVLDPDGKGKAEGIDRETLAMTIKMLPDPITVVGTYLGGPDLSGDNDKFLADKKEKLAHFIDHFEGIQYAMLHPAPANSSNPDIARMSVDAWCELADFAVGKKEGFQLCLHNHYDSACETADQVRAHLDLIRSANHPGLTWGPDTGHCHGMGDAYLEVFDEYADLIGNHFHIKARVPAFDQLHGGDDYRADRDIWGNDAEIGKGLYSGFVNCADPAQPIAGIVTGAMEIDIPRQHPKLEIMCTAMYLKAAHGIAAGQDLDYGEIAQRVFS